MIFNFNSNDFNKKILLLIVFFLTLLCFNKNVFAATEGNKNNVYDNIYSLTQYTTVESLLKDSGLAPDREFVNDFLQDKKYTNKYIISYCNSSDCESGAMNRSIGLIAFNDDVSAEFIQNGRNLNIKFKGDPDSVVYVYKKSTFLPSSGESALSFIDYNMSFNSFRAVLPVSSVGSLNQLLPSMLFDNVFNNFKREIKTLIIEYIGYILGFVVFMIFVFLVVHYLKRIRRYMLWLKDF